MGKLHAEAMSEWTATGDLASTNGTVNGPAAIAFIRQYTTHVSVSFSAATATTVGTIVVNYGASSSFKFQVPVGASGLYLNFTLTKAIRGDINFQTNVVLAGFTAGPVASVNLAGYKIRE